MKNILIRRETNKIIRTIKIPRVLDVGFGYGQRIYYLLQRNKKAGVLGIDISDKAVMYANKYFNYKKYPNLYCYKKDISNITDTNSFDIVYAFKSLNYIKNDDDALERMFQALKPGGTLLILNSVASDKDEQQFYDKNYGLPSFRDGYFLEDLESKLESIGFSGIKSRYLYGYFGRKSWNFIIGFPIKMWNKSKAFILLFPFYLIIVAPIATLFNLYEIFIGHRFGRSLFIKAIK